MGTNYYWHRDVCDKCKRPAQIVHIGKSSGGWSFSFHGFKNEYGDNLPIRSIDDWEKFIAEPNSVIVDEYDRVVGAAEFWKLVKSKRGGTNHTEYCRERAAADGSHKYAYEDCWLDGRGNSFSSVEFS